jgi:hypothetical protein
MISEISLDILSGGSKNMPMARSIGLNDKKENICNFNVTGQYFKHIKEVNHENIIV